MTSDCVSIILLVNWQQQTFLVRSVSQGTSNSSHVDIIIIIIIFFHRTYLDIPTSFNILNVQEKSGILRVKEMEGISLCSSSIYKVYFSLFAVNLDWNRHPARQWSETKAMFACVYLQVETKIKNWSEFDCEPGIYKPETERTGDFVHLGAAPHQGR